MQQVLEACSSTRRNVIVSGDRRAAELLLQALANTIASRFRVVVIADRDVAETVEHGQHQWNAHQRDDVDDRRQQEHRPQHAFPVEPVAALPRISEGRRIHLGARAHGRLPLRSSRSPVSR